MNTTTEIIEKIETLGYEVSSKTKSVKSPNGMYFFLREDISSIYTLNGDCIEYSKIHDITSAGGVIFIIVKNDDESMSTLQFQAVNKIEMSPRNLFKLLPVFIPEIDSYMYYDTMRSRGMINRKLWGDKDEFVPIDNWDLSEITSACMEGMEDCGFKKRFPEKIELKAIDTFLYNHQRNLWVEWLEGLVWDGVKRVDTWFQDAIGASAPAIKDEVKEQQYLSTVTRCFFNGVIKRGFEETVLEIIPVLIGTQGDGKTSLVRFMAGPNPSWYKSVKSEVMDEKVFWEMTNGGKIVELSEGKALKTADVEELKGFVSKSSDTFREAYGRFSKDYIRPWGMIATSNSIKMFVDKTGNRRFYPMICDRSKAKYKFYDDMVAGDYHIIEQVWAEAYHDYKTNPDATCVIDSKSEIACYASMMQEMSTFDDDRWLFLDSYLDDDENHLHTIGSRISKADIFEKVFGVDPRNPPKELSYSVTRWIECTKKWKLINVTTYNGKTCRNVLERVINAGSPIELFGSVDAFMRKYYDFLRKEEIHFGDSAHLQQFLKYANIPTVYYDQVAKVLVDELAIYDDHGVWKTFGYE